MPFKKLTTVLPVGRMSGGKDRYTDTNEFLSPGVLVAYKAAATGQPAYPDANVKSKLNKAAVQARNMVRIANDRLAEVVLQRKKEPDYFIDTMERHFYLGRNPTDLAGGDLVENIIDKPFSLKSGFKKDRRWALSQIRQKMLSLSFHLNTGMYLIDIDYTRRDKVLGAAITTATAMTNSDEGYDATYANSKFWKLSGFNNGEVHIAFEKLAGYGRNSAARVIIHECAHKYLFVDDQPNNSAYAREANYPPKSFLQCMDNADSFAWTAVSLALKECKMDSVGAFATDWQALDGGKL